MAPALTPWPVASAPDGNDRASQVSPAALREDDLPRETPQVLNQAHRVLGPVLAIGIHHHHGVAGSVVVDVTEARRDRSLVSEVAP